MGLLSREEKGAMHHARGDTEGLAKVLERENFQSGPDGHAVDLDADEKVDAANALAGLPDGGTADALAAGLRSPAQNVRAAAIQALGHTPDPHARQALGVALGGPADVRDELGRSMALQALIGRDDASARDLVEVLTQPGEGLVVDLEHKAALATMVDAEGDSGLRDVTDELVTGLFDPDEGRRTRARELLVSLGEKAVDPTVAAMDRPEARREAAIVLGRLRSVRAVDKLVDTLADEGPAVRAAAAWALGEIRDPIAIEPLTPLTRDPSYNVRAAASNAINAFGNVAVLAHVSSLLVPVIEDLERVGGEQAALSAAPQKPLPAPEEPRPAPGEPRPPQPAHERVTPRRALGRFVRQRLGIR